MKDEHFTIYERIAFFSGTAALTIGVVVIFGWLINNPVLTELQPNWVAMKVNTALGFILAGTSILSLLRCNESSEKFSLYRQIARFCAISLFIVGGLTSIEYLLSINLHIDELFIRQTPSKWDFAPAGRMSPFTAFMQVNYAIALWLLSNPEKKALSAAIAQACAFTGGAIGTLALIGYLLNAKELYSVGHTTAIAAHTAIGFLAVSLGILFLEPKLAWMHTFTSQTRIGEILRRFVPLALFLPIVIGWLSLSGLKEGLYSIESGIAAIVTFCIISWQSGIFWLTRKFQVIETELSEREEQLKGQAELLNLTQDAIFVRDLSAKIIFWNRGAEIMYGYPKSEALGTISHDLLKTKFLVPLEDIESILSDTGRWEGELIHQTKNQERITVASRWALQKDAAGDPIACLEINNDIRAAKEAEQRVSKFYSTVSHELRTPLTSIRGVFGLFEGGKAGELSPRAKQLATMGLGETERLIRLINDILDLKKIEAGKLELKIENLEPKNLVEHTINAVTGFAAQYKVQLVADVFDNNLVKGDKDRLIQILTNLISNAIKFSDPEQPVIISTTACGNNVRFSVIDKGPGIDSRNIAKLFRMFQQIDSVNQPKGGTGLGLAVCKSLVEQHGGTIGIESELGKGSTFWFEIPCV